MKNNAKNRRMMLNAQWTCEQKIRYPTEPGAKAAALYIYSKTSKKKHFNATLQRAYQCLWCDQWHLTSKQE